MPALVAAVLGVAGVAALRAYVVEAPAGDYQVRQGDILLTDGAYDQAIERFAAALAIDPEHRGALMGKAIALLQSGRLDEAEAAFTAVVARLEPALAAGDATCRGVLAGALANRGILRDRAGRYAEALVDYRRALTIDAAAVAGPGLVDRVLYGTVRPATVDQRATYLERQLALPERERLLRVPDLDARQRMYKP
jgi:tetratricopeptide (TPR) repeat protein